MNNRNEEEIRYRLLKLLVEEQGLSQREMAKRAGVSLGKVNYCISELARKGMIKVIRFKSARDKKPYIYLLTPMGIQEKARLTVRFLRQKLVEFEQIKRQIWQLAGEVDKERLTEIPGEETASVIKLIS